MSIRALVELNEDGSFTTHGRGVDCHLIYDAEPEGNRWLLLHSTNANVDHVLSAHLHLDDALVALVSAAHDVDERFSVQLPTGEIFSRPGHVSAEEVLAAHGYALVDGLVAFALYEPEVDLSVAEAQRSVREMLHGKHVVVGSVSPMNDEQAGWCCDFRVPFEGYIHRQAMDGYVERLLAGTGLEFADVVEFEDCGVEVLDHSNVVAFPRAA